MASRFAANQLAANDKDLKGVFFFASYPDEKGSLADQSISVLSLTGSQDQVVNQENWQAARSFLPESTTFQTIEGGNHAGFGTYGLQKEKPPLIYQMKRSKKPSLCRWLRG